MSPVTTVTFTDARIREIFFKAASLMETYGCIVGDRGSVHKGFCVIGAIEAAHTPEELQKRGWGDRFTVATRLDKLLGLKVQYDQHNGTHDTPEYRAAAWSNNLVDAGKGAEVIAGLRTAANLLFGE